MNTPLINHDFSYLDVEKEAAFRIHSLCQIRNLVRLSALNPKFSDMLPRLKQMAREEEERAVHRLTVESEKALRPILPNYYLN